MHYLSSGYFSIFNSSPNSLCIWAWSWIIQPGPSCILQLPAVTVKLQSLPVLTIFGLTFLHPPPPTPFPLPLLQVSSNSPHPICLSCSHCLFFCYCPIFLPLQTQMSSRMLLSLLPQRRLHARCLLVTLHFSPCGASTAVVPARLWAQWQ